MEAIASLAPFPAISWWTATLGCTSITFDLDMPFQKMGMLNRYRITGANNPILLSIPLEHGRNQRTAVGAIGIHNWEKWQVQHWRTLESVYRRTPYWEFYEPGLKKLYEQPFSLLIDFNKAALDWALRALQLKVEVSYKTSVSMTAAGINDLRQPGILKADFVHFPKYYQVFADRHGFLPDLSIIDLLFSEGNRSLNWLINNKVV